VTRMRPGPRSWSPTLMTTSRKATLYPLVLAAMASQALLVVLSPSMVAIASEFGASVGIIGQARSITGVVAIAASVAITGRIEEIGVPRLLRLGGAMAVSGCAGVAAAPTLTSFLGAHVLVGAGFACLLSAGFTGVAAFPRDRRAWAMGYVAGANALAWIVVSPTVGVFIEEHSWRVAQIVPATIALAAFLCANRASSLQPGDSRSPRLLTLLFETSARRWIASELVAYGAWTGLLTFSGAFFVEGLQVEETTVGWILAAGATNYFLASTGVARLCHRVPGRHLVAGSAVAMSALLLILLTVTTSRPIAIVTFGAIGLTAGIRTPASSALGLEQLPSHPGSMMAARTAATQLGYLLGAVAGGAVIAGGGYGALGWALSVGMVTSGLLVLRVRTPMPSDSLQPASATP
jgi:predicted MFS family arabinose efflux permease